MIEVASAADTAEIATRSVSVGELRDFARACGLTQAGLERCSTSSFFNSMPVPLYPTFSVTQRRFWPK